MIADEKGAREAVAEVAKWLSDEVSRTWHNKAGYPYEPPQADLARDFCGILLDASAASGCGGCELCGS